jgi:hypothetical protein
MSVAPVFVYAVNESCKALDNRRRVISHHVGTPRESHGWQSFTRWVYITMMSDHLLRCCRPWVLARVRSVGRSFVRV